MRDVEGCHHQFGGEQSVEVCQDLVEQRVLATTRHQANLQSVGLNLLHQCPDTFHQLRSRLAVEVGRLHLVHAVSLFVTKFASPLLACQQLNGLDTPHALVAVGSVVGHLEAEGGH